jgi:DNA (cytosine-5)-methyltransferase 1
MELTHLDLYSGIGGFALGFGWAGFETVGFAEIDEYASAVLKARWPEVENYGDVRAIDGKRFKGVSVITGGFPCQPYSMAGRKRGTADSRDEWPTVRRIIHEAEPDWFVGENVAHFTNMALSQCCNDLESIGYECAAFDLPACAIGLPSVERHVWIIAARGGELLPGSCEEGLPRAIANGASELRPPSDSAPWKCGGWNIPKPHTLRSRKGIPAYVDRIRALGNAVPPGIVYLIAQAIKKTKGTQ